MARGNRQGAIFKDDDDRRFFLKALSEACGKMGWRVHAWVLMTNHYHVFLERPASVCRKTAPDRRGQGHLGPQPLLTWQPGKQSARSTNRREVGARRAPEGGPLGSGIGRVAGCGSEKGKDCASREETDVSFAEVDRATPQDAECGERQPAAPPRLKRYEMIPILIQRFRKCCLSPISFDPFLLKNQKLLAPASPIFVRPLFALAPFSRSNHLADPSSLDNGDSAASFFTNASPLHPSLCSAIRLCIFDCRAAFDIELRRALHKYRHTRYQLIKVSRRDVRLGTPFEYFRHWATFRNSGTMPVSPSQ